MITSSLGSGHPRAGLSSHDVVAAAAELADEAGLPGTTMGLLAQRLGIRAPSLYKHVTDLADLRPPRRHPGHERTGRGGPRRPAGQVRPGRSHRPADRIPGLRHRPSGPVCRHHRRPGSPARTIRCSRPSARVIDSVAAALRGYGIGDAEMVHAIRTIRSTIHGFAMLQASDGFQWTGRTRRHLRLDDRVHRPRPANHVHARRRRRQLAPAMPVKKCQ